MKILLGVVLSITVGAGVCPQVNDVASIAINIRHIFIGVFAERRA